MSRRRRKNPFLARAILISIGVNLIVLPILAYFGAFKKLAAQYAPSQVVLVQTQELKKEIERAKTKPDKKPDEKKSEASHGAKLARHAGAAKPNPNAPKIETAGGPGAGGGGSAVESGTGKAGVVPVSPGGSGTVPAPKPKSTAPSEVAPVSQPTPKPAPPLPPKPRTPGVYAAPTIADGPEPSIPDDLRDDVLDKTFIAEFVVGPDGVPKSVQTAQSTGVDELDRIALDAARHWRFHPATLDGVGVESHVRLQVEFKVE